MMEMIQNSFLEEVMRRSGQDIVSCYQCRKCAAGCPVAEYMDLLPNAVHRMIQYNRKEALLQCASIWICAGCEVCGTRCPNGIETAKVMDALKQMADEENSGSKAKNIRTMHRAFLSGVRKRGRMHELSLIGEMRMKSGGLFKDLKLGIEMFKKGKLSILPNKIKNTKELKALFKKAKGVS